MKKYELTEETKEFNCHTLHRIRALRDIPRYLVNAGDMGGWIESERNLSQEGDCWVGDEACVYDSCAYVAGNAFVRGSAIVSNNAHVCGNAEVYGEARISGSAIVIDGAIVCELAIVDGFASVDNNSKVCKNAHVTGNAHITDRAIINAGIIKNRGDYIYIRNFWDKNEGVHGITYIPSVDIWNMDMEDLTFDTKQLLLWSTNDDYNPQKTEAFKTLVEFVKKMEAIKKIHK